MKGRIIHILKSSTDVVSGEELSRVLEISRVAVWKHIRTLQTLGYSIDASAKGYRLAGTEDLLYPWEFGDREAFIHYHATISSTMDAARALARNGCPGRTVVVAECQQKGRGRRNRLWRSAKGGLYLTLVSRPEISPVISPRFNFAAALTVAEMLRSRYDVPAQLKWPNDVLVSGKKICGILSEMEAQGDEVTFINIGLGLNVNNDPSKEEPEAVSLKRILNKAVRRRELLSDLLDRLERQFHLDRLETVIHEWKQHSTTLNRSVRIVTPWEEIKGIAGDVDENGALLVRMDNGCIRKIFYGDCVEGPPF